MGKSSRKLQRKTKKEKVMANGEAVVQEIAEIRRLKDEGNYDGALQFVIASFESHGMYAETAFEAAEIYYLSGDYERAAIWCNKTMDLQSGHPGVALLLAKIALMQDKTEKALALMDKLARQGLYKEELEDLLQIVLLEESDERIIAEYPVLWRFLKESTESAESNEMINMEFKTSTCEIEDKEVDLTSLKSRLLSLTAAADPIHLQEKTIDKDVEAAEDSFKNFGDKEKTLESVLAGFSSEKRESQEMQASSFSLTAAGEAGQQEEPAKQMLENKGTIVSFNILQNEIMEQSVSLREKIALCHRKAAGFYAARNFAAAVSVLELALSIDRTDDLTLKNLGFILLEMGKKAEAVSYFAEIKSTDLMVLQVLR